MKKLAILLSAMLLSAVTLAAQDGKTIYQKYSDAEQVSAVYISPAMFRLIGNIPDLKAGDNEVNLTPVITTLSGMYLINSSNPGINHKLSSDVKKFVGAGKFELLMEAKDSGEAVRMYTCGDEDTVTSFVMHADDGAEVTFICLDGKMPRKQLEDLIASSAK